MAGTITHKWNGTILTVTSDAGTSSADLKGVAGNIGPRGPQGPAGVVVDSAGAIDLTDYATRAYVDAAVANVDVDLTNYYTKSEVNAKIPDVSGYATDTDVAVAVSGLASEVFVTTKIAEAQLSGADGSGVDLSGFRTLDNNRFDGALTIDDGANTLHLFPVGITGDSGLWIGRDGTGQFTSLTINSKPVATQEYVNSEIAKAIAALDGDGVDY